MNYLLVVQVFVRTPTLSRFNRRQHPSRQPQPVRELPEPDRRPAPRGPLPGWLFFLNQAAPERQSQSRLGRICRAAISSVFSLLLALALRPSRAQQPHKIRRATLILRGSQPRLARPVPIRFSLLIWCSQIDNSESFRGQSTLRRPQFF